MLKVAKFGGSSVASPEQFKKVKHIVSADEDRKIIVVSAAGKKDSSDHKLTDLLYLLHAHLNYGVSGEDIVSEISSRFKEIRLGLGLESNIENEFNAYASALTRDTPVDELVSRGEYFTARLMAEYLGFMFVDAADCVFFGSDGRIDKEKSYAAIKAAFEKYGRILIPGFYGSLPNGRVKVMSRGGSDISGSLAAAAVNADVYENWTDVSGILMADPRIVDNPRPIPTLTFNELRELAFSGASVLHEDSVQPVRECGIPLNIRNTNSPDDPGTMIVEKAEDDDDSDERFITGIAGRRNFVILTVIKHDMSGEELCKTLSILQSYKIPVENITLGIDTFALVVSEKALDDRVFEIIADVRKACHPDDIKTQDGISLVSAVGRKMPFKPGVSGKLFKALGDNDVNIRTIAQGADELSIMVGVENKMFETAIRVLYEGFAG